MANKKNAGTKVQSTNDNNTSSNTHKKNENSKDKQLVVSSRKNHHHHHGKIPEPGYDLVPPDGGWGWLILVGSTVINILVPGTIKSFGVLFVEFLEVFDATPTTAAWIPALCYFLYSSLGPLSSILSVKYSYRTVTLIGGTCAAVGMMLSFWASSVTYLYIRVHTQKNKIPQKGAFQECCLLRRNPKALFI